MRHPTTTAWVDEVEAWVTDALADQGLRPAGRLLEAETRPWSTVWSIQTDGGRVWFKETEPTSRHEPMVHAALARLAPSRVDAPLAVGPGRGWLLSRDGGVTVAATGPAANRGVEWDTLPLLLADYATLQRATLDAADTLQAAGLPRMPPTDAAGTATAQAEVMASYAPHDPRHLRPEQAQSVLDAVPELTAAADVLRAGPVPLAFDHGDLFPRNVFQPESPARPYRFFDFAESVWAHPFSSLVMLVPELRHRWHVHGQAGTVDCRDPRIRAVIDSYLAGWRDYAELPELRALTVAALRLAPLHRSTPWLRTLADADEAVLDRHGRTPWAWLSDVTLPVLL